MNFSEQFLRASEESKALQLTVMSHVAVLIIISRSENGAILANIARQIKVSAAGMTHIADSLTKMGFAKRVHEENLDRRAIRLCITAKGRDALDMILNPKPKHV